MTAGAVRAVRYLGSYLPDYPRHRVIQRGLRDLGVSVDETVVTGALPGRWARLAGELAGVAPGTPVIVGEASNYLTPALWEARRRRLPLVFDPFVSLRDSLEDRRPGPAARLLAPLFGAVDRLNNAPASAVLCDTPQMRDYYVGELGLSPERAFVAPVGAETDLFAPRERGPERGGPLRVLFYGTFIPLQGIEVIIRAAAEAARRRPIEVRVVGTGQTAAEMRRLAREVGGGGVVFGPERVPYRELPALIAGADVCLGIFARRPKTMRVIPNKLYQCAAAGVPVVTADTPAVRWGFRPGELVLVPPGDAGALADALVALADDPALRARVGAAGASAVRARFGPVSVAAAVLEACRSALWRT